MKVRWNPKQQRFPKLTGKVVVDTFRGTIRVRKWPRKRGPSKLAKQQRQVKWFTDANALAKRAWHEQIKLAMVMTKGTGLYPRDLLLGQMSGGIFDIHMEDGRHYLPRTFFRETKMFQGAILQLDAPRALPANTIVTFSWPLPILDTLGFWDVATPDRLTIREGVEVVELFAGWAAVGAAGTNRNLTLIYKNGGLLRGINWQSILDPNDAVATGPLKVDPGDFFQAKALYGSATSALGNERTFFSLNVLGAV